MGKLIKTDIENKDIKRFYLFYNEVDIIRQQLADELDETGTIYIRHYQPAYRNIRIRIEQTLP